MIVSTNCPVCGTNIAAEEVMLNHNVREHHTKMHPQLAEEISKAVEEIGSMKDKIDRIKKKIKRISGYRIPY